MGAIRTLPQFSFNRGEVSPRHAAAANREFYQTGLSLCENWIVLPEGILTRRPGTRFMSEVKDSSKSVILLSFEYSATDSYLLEIGESYIRFYRDLALILDTEDNPYEVVTTYTEAELENLDFEQVGDEVYILHQDHAPAVLKRNDHADWTLNDVAFVAKPAEWVANNYPRRLTLHQERMAYASTPAEPLEIWWSRSPNTSGHRLNDLTIGTQADDAVNFPLLAKKRGAIQWVSSGRALYIGTLNETRTLSGAGSFNEPLSATSILNRPHATIGSAAINPIELENSVLFVTKDGRSIREFIYSFENDAFLAPNRTLASQHITKTGIKSFASTQDPVSIIWAVRNDGILIGMTFEAESGTYAWHRHKIAGSYNGNDYAKVESIASIPHGTRDVLFMVVARTINGQTKRYIEYLEEFFEPETDTDYSGAVFLDSSVSFGFNEGDTAGNQFSGLSHLEAESVSILGDSREMPDQVVSGGQITLGAERTALKVTAGLGYRSLGQTLRPDPGSFTGSGWGNVKSVVAASMDVLETASLMVGKDIDNLHTHTFIKSTQNMANVPPLKTGKVDDSILSELNKNGQFAFGAQGPLPCTIRSIVARLHIGS